MRRKDVSEGRAKSEDAMSGGRRGTNLKCTDIMRCLRLAGAADVEHQKKLSTKRTKNYYEA